MEQDKRLTDQIQVPKTVKDDNAEVIVAQPTALQDGWEVDRDMPAYRTTER